LAFSSAKAVEFFLGQPVDGFHAFVVHLAHRAAPGCVGLDAQAWRLGDAAGRLQGGVEEGSDGFFRGSLGVVGTTTVQQRRDP
jgi:hypothetical protein